VTNIAFIFETSPNTKPLQIQMRKTWGRHGILYTPPEKVGGHVPRVPHQIAPMMESTSTKIYSFHQNNLPNHLLFSNSTFYIPQSVFSKRVKEKTQSLRSWKC